MLRSIVKMPANMSLSKGRRVLSRTHLRLCVKKAGSVEQWSEPWYVGWSRRIIIGKVANG